MGLLNGLVGRVIFVALFVGFLAGCAINPSGIYSISPVVKRSEWQAQYYMGYDVSFQADGSITYVWTPGQPHPIYPNVLCSSEMAEWRPARGYFWKNDDPEDFQVFEGAPATYFFSPEFCTTDRGKWLIGTMYKNPETQQTAFQPTQNQPWEQLSPEEQERRIQSVSRYARRSGMNARINETSTRQNNAYYEGMHHSAANEAETDFEYSGDPDDAGRALYHREAEETWAE